MQLCFLLLVLCLSAYSEEITETTSTSATEFETTVTVKKEVNAAGSQTVRDRDLKLRPVRRPADVLQVTPGLYITQHAGGGKANQYFLRGYDADHGTDVALFVDGIPINNPSHGHGQGYSDLHFLLLESVDRVEVSKGPFFPELGDFATAGAINIITKKTQSSNAFGGGFGMFGTARAYLISPERFFGLTPLIAAEIYGTDGPFQSPERTKRFNYLAKFAKDISKESTLSLGTSGYGGQWNASGQIPNRAVKAGTLDRFGSLDATEGGDSHRYSFFGNYDWRPEEETRLRALAYVNFYRLSLFSNFTFFSADPTNGDQIQQRDNRVTKGADISYKMKNVVVGVQGRHDSISNGLYNTKARSLLSTTREDDVKVGSVALYANHEMPWANWFKTIVGGRGDYYFFSVSGTGNGSRNAGLLSPKVSFVFSPQKDLDLFLNYGHGFHSNDARGLFEATPATPLAKTYAYEAGSRLKLWDGRLDLAGAFFLQYADDELTFSGDAGTTESTGPTKRMGAELEARLRVLDWLFIDTDVNLVRAELRSVPETDNAISNAPTRIISGGVSAQHPDGFFGRFGFFHIAERPLTEDRFIQAEGFVRFDATVGMKGKSYEVALAVQNLFNTKWNEAQFATTSRISGEASGSCPAGTREQTDSSGGFAGCEDLHFTPGNPINIQATAAVYF